MAAYPHQRDDPRPGGPLGDLLRPLEAGGTGLVLVTMSDGRVTELWVDGGRLSHATCAGVDPLHVRLGVRVPAGSGRGHPAELLSAGVAPDAIRQALVAVAGDIWAELSATGLARVQVVQADHPHRHLDRSLADAGDQPDGRPGTDATAPPRPADPDPGPDPSGDGQGVETSAALRQLIEGVRDL
jgi:hypothetical protein